MSDILMLEKNIMEAFTIIKIINNSNFFKCITGLHFLSIIQIKLI